MLESLVEPSTRGDPMSPLCWTLLSLSQLSAELTKRGHPASTFTVARLLHERGYSLQSNRKTQEGDQHPDRDAQFRYISGQTRRFQSRGQPVISVDTKKKEFVGKFKNAGREWRPKGQPREVNVHDFRDDKIGELGGKAIPYGVYDLANNAGWVSVGIDHDTPDFAVQSIRAWWLHMGRRTYSVAKDLLITADSLVTPKRRPFPISGSREVVGDDGKGNGNSVSERRADSLPAGLSCRRDGAVRAPRRETGYARGRSVAGWPAAWAQWPSRARARPKR
jgi:hypothetical protein